MGVTVSPDWNTIRNKPTVVNSFNGSTGAVTGVASFNGSTGAVTGVASFNGSTGAVTGVNSVNGNTGAVTAAQVIAANANAAIGDIGSYAWATFNTTGKSGITTGATLGGASTSVPAYGSYDGSTAFTVGGAMPGTWRWLGITTAANTPTCWGPAVRIA